MNRDDPTSIPVLPGRRRARQLRWAGLAILLLGLCGVGLDYILEKPPEALPDGFTSPDDSKIQTQTTEVNYGRQGVVIGDLMAALKQPHTQMLIGALASVVLAAACFYLARLSEYDDQPD
jgi:hypothetical protein